MSRLFTVLSSVAGVHAINSINRTVNFFKSITTLLLIVCSTLQLFAQEIPPRPNPPRLVTDFTNTLSASELSALENKLVAFNDSSSVQIAVVMMSTLDGYPLSDYSFKLAEQWGIGQKGKNNGVLLLISMNERKMFIAPGYGLEGAMPDAYCKRIIEEDIKPFFKQQQYYEGIDAGTTQIINLARGDYQPTAPAKRKGKGVPIPALLIMAAIFAVIFLSRIRSVSRYSSLNSIPFWAAWGLLNATRGRQSGSWGSFTSGGGGFGGFGGGSGGGGGFGGFGGGSFGGGGAGGSW